MKLLLILVACLLFAGAASAALFTGVILSGNSGGVPGTTCTNSLNFTQPCNSQYLAAIGR